MDKDLIYKIGIGLLPGVGIITAKKLIAYLGSIEAVFKSTKSQLMKVPDVGSVVADNIVKQDILARAEQELKFIERYKINPVFFTDKNYPERLKNCIDSPLILFVKGNNCFNEQKIISIVGTRNATDYGKAFTEKLIADIAEKHPETIIVSGLAYGIDIYSHKAALANNLKTLAVLGHGLDKMYPSVHKKYAKEILEKDGALITEFMSESNPDKQNFVKRNRIVAGISDATIVIESGRKGGSLITAEIANSYNRDVFALPGRIEDEFSKGCNFLIKTNRAALLESASDIEYIMGWESNTQTKKQQREIKFDFSDDEQKIINLLQEKSELTIDVIASNANMPVSQVASLLLNLEFSGIIRNLPGKVFRLV
ncbi:MAG TPA: DNA-protecting protein DprA [Bacteroidales bacterium]|nr:MAG: DNA protecting protein DprA [Bacteroidetes bacterium GWF2_33_38]OFY89717.1 MAG: DNA protecting protein DprA [Bacteroidetes bacterium RIFOXYA2_FULL_33_7]HBF88067.1 DNA-protecting protein DprA [Bacteroidales bacterium]